MLEDLKNNKLYRKQMFLPINASNKKKGSLIYLLSPNIEETARVMASSYFKNPNLFNAYYLEKDINLIINENMVYNEERNPYDPAITLSKYTRYTITDSNEMEKRTGKKLHGSAGILFLEPYTEKYVGYLIVNGSTLVDAYSISAAMDKELMAFAVDILKCNICHKNIDNKYKKILKSEYDFKFAGSSAGVSPNAITLEGEGSIEIASSALLTEGMTRINMELAMWKAQAKITELIIKNWDNTNWMRTQYKSMKAKLNRIPLPGFIDKIDDSIESMKDYYENQKETIKFMTEMAAFELKEEYDLSDITKEYTRWVRSTRSSKEFKLKLIREVKDSYKETIKVYKMNLKRYEVQTTAEKRVENAVALVGKTFSIFSFLTGGPLGILKDVVMKAILPKSKKKNVLSVSEIEAKIAAYEKIVEELEDLEEEIKNESTNEYTAMASMNPVIGIGSGPIAKNITSKGRVFSGEDDEDEALQESGVILEGSFEDLVNNIDTSKVGKFLKISAMSILTSPVVGFVLLGHELKKDNDKRKAKEKEYEKRVYKNISNALKNAGLEYLTKDDFIKMAKEDYLTPDKHYQQWLDYMGYIVYMNSHAKESDAKNFVFDYITLDGTKYARFNLTSKDNKILYSYIICKKKSNKDTLAFVRILERGKEVEKNAYTVYVDRKPLRNKAAENRKKLADEGDTTWQNDPDNLYSYMISHIDETEKNYLAAYNAAAQVYKSSKILKKHAKLKNASSKIRKLDESKDIVEQIYYKWDNLEIISAEVEPPSKINSDGKDEQIIFWNEFEEARKAAENALLDKDHFAINSEGSRRDIYMALWPKKVSEKKGFFRNLVKEDSLLEETKTVIDPWIISNLNSVKNQYKSAYNAFKSIYDKSTKLNQYGRMKNSIAEFSNIDEAYLTIYWIPQEKSNKVAFDNKNTAYYDELEKAVNAAKAAIKDTKYLSIEEDNLGSSGDYIVFALKKTTINYNMLDRVKDIFSKAPKESSNDIYDNNKSKIDSYLSKNNFKAIDVSDKVYGTAAVSSIGGTKRYIFLDNKYCIGTNNGIQILCKKSNDTNIYIVEFDSSGSGRISKTVDASKYINIYKSIYEDALLESPLTAEQRKNLKDSDFGLPAKRAYPMPDKAHVKSAIRMFNHVDKQDEKILASAINRKIKEFDMEDEVTVSKKNRYYEYCPSSIREGVEIKPLRTVAVLQEDTFIRDDQSITYFESALSEDATYNKALRRVLFSERLRNQKDVSLHYDAIKEACPFIRQTYYDIDKYRKYNLFVDMTYYIETFIKNNYLKLDKSVNLFFELINRFLRDERFKNAGYNKRTVFVPITGWKVEPNTDIWDYKYNINPISIIYRLIFSGSIERLQQEWGDINFVFIGKNGYFKFTANSMDKKFIPLFRNNVQRLLDGSYIDDSDEPDNSVKGIVADVIARIEKPDDVTDSGIKVNNLLGDDEELTPEEFAERIDASDVSSEDEDEKGLDAEQETIRMEREKELVKRVKEVAKDAASSDDAINKLNNDEDFKQILQDLKMSSPNAVDYSVTRVSRINKLKSDFANTKLDKNKTIGDVVLSDKYFANELPETSVPIDTTNEEWKHLKGANFSDNYSVDNDIYRILYHFSECKVPVAIREVKVEDTSTSEDTVNTWTVACEDINGKRFTLKFDVPIVINKRFMKLRGNEKVMGTQLMNLPIIKTDQHTVQITTNYNKIFISPYGSTAGKSFVTSDRLIKALSKYKGKNITFVTGDNSKVCRKYELPIDYIDLASNYMSIKGTSKTIGTYEFLFNQDIVNETYKKFINKDKLLIGIHTDLKGKQNPIYLDPTITLSSQVAGTLCGLDTEFQEIYNSTSVSSKYMYSLASIMSTHIPVAVLIGYAIGLTSMLDRAGIKYTVEDKRPRYDKSTQDILILKDAYILYDLTYDSSMLLNGLKDCDLDNYSIKEVNSSPMWLDFLDNYGGRIKSDGLDMFYDLMFDPITKNVCLQYDLPNNYIDALLYANMLLSDNKYNKHVDIRGNRYRNNEIIAAYTYKALCNSYSMYRRALKVGRDAPMSIKQSAVIDLILQDNTESDYSSLSPLLEFEAANAVSFKGLSGMNSDRAYGLDKRTYDASMVNILAMSTGFASNAGVNRQSTIDPNISTNRGYIQSNPDKLNITNTFCMTEALTPYGVTSDDPFRTAMTFIQTNKHGMRTAIGDPSMVSTGADEALVYLTSDTFSYKAKGKGKIKEKTEDYMVIEYDYPIGYDKDASKTEVVDLREKMVKNSDGGFYQSLKLDTDYKVGDTVRKDDIVAIDKLSYNNTVGPTNNYAYDIGTFCKFAVVMSDEGFEDSCRNTQWLAKAMSSTVVVEQEYNFNKDTNIYYLAKKGQSVQEGEPILIFQNAFEDEDANALIRALKAEDEDNVVEELGRITLKSKVTGVVKDIKIRRCVETDECSPTMQKVIKDYEKSVKDINKAFDKYDKAKAKSADPTYKLPATGKLKNSEDCVLITIYIAYQDDFGVSDKTVCYSALKGVSSKEIIPEGKEAFSTFRPDEKIHYIQSEIGDMKRMVGSVYKMGALNKVLVETHRHMCDIMGIKWKYYDEWDK